METPMTKICSKCKIEKSLEDFHKHKRMRKGTASMCKACRSLHRISIGEHSGSELPFRLLENEFTKYCFKCKTLKSLDDFYKSNYWSYRKNSMSSCKKCIINTVTQRKYRKINLGEVILNQWEDLKKKYNYSCLSCNKKEPEIKLSIDHIIPVSLGGQNSIDNIQPLCISCNSKKKIKIIDYRY